MMESWRDCWRRGVAPLLSTKGLEALRQALVNDDRRLLQGVTTEPPLFQCVQDWPVRAACPLGFCGWAEGLTTVAEVTEYFARMCFEIDQQMGEPAACRWFLNAWDDTPRELVRKELLAEVLRSLGERLLATN
jgi:hypothetical protein